MKNKPFRLLGFVPLLAIAYLAYADAPVPATLVGATPGSFEVSPSGAASYRIPIDVPPGTAGTQPKLALVYNSQGGNGLLGTGWSLEGLSAITRCPQTFAQDGVRRDITFTGVDRFCLDGKRLIRTGGAAPYGAADSEYRTEIDGFSKIVAKGGQGGGPAWFQVSTKSGDILQYGLTVVTETLSDSQCRRFIVIALSAVIRRQSISPWPASECP